MPDSSERRAIKKNKIVKGNKMGTRNLTAVQKDGKYIIAQYGQWDGYPECAGLTILKFLSKPKNIDRLKIKLDKCRWITQEEIDNGYEKVGVSKKDTFINMEQAEKFHLIYPLLNRDIGYNILSVVANLEGDIILKNSISFANDSLFCEWGYVVDFDKNTFEIYQGFNKEPLAESERFYNPNITIDGNNEYYPIKHLKTYSLDNLPNIETFNKEIIDHFEQE